MTINFEKSLEIGASPEEALAQWGDLTTWPRFMPHVREVIAGDENRWTLETPEGSWALDITSDTPGGAIGWRVSTPDHSCDATVRFIANEDGQGSRIVYTAHYPSGLGPGHSAADVTAAMDQCLAGFASMLGGNQEAEEGEAPAAADADVDAVVNADADVALDARTDADMGANANANANADVDIEAEARAFQPTDALLRASLTPAPWRVIGAASDAASDAATEMSEEVTDPLQNDLPQIIETTEHLQQTLSQATQAWTDSVAKSLESMHALLWSPVRSFASRRGGTVRSWAPRIECTRGDGMLFVSSELPGYSADDIHVEIRDGQLLISGERHIADAFDEQFEQSMRLDVPVDSRQVEAELDAGGQLRIALPLKAEAREGANA